jgi:hypothetical protein
VLNFPLGVAKGTRAKEAKRMGQLKDDVNHKRKRIETAEGDKTIALAKMEGALADKKGLKKRAAKLKQQKGDVIATKKEVVGGLKEKVAGLQEASSQFGKECSNKAGGLRRPACKPPL